MKLSNEQEDTAFIELDSRGKILRISGSAAGFLGWREEEVRGLKLAEKVARRGLFELLTLFRRALSKGSASGLVELESRNTGYLPVRLVVHAVEELEGGAAYHCTAEER